MKILIRLARANSSAIVVALSLLAWSAVAYFGWLGPTLIASPSEVIGEIVEAFDPDAGRDERLHIHALHTFWRAFVGWGIGLLLGMAIGLLVGVRKSIYVATEPLVEFLRAIPPILLFPLLLVGFNFETPAYVWTIVCGCLPVMVLTTARGIQSISVDKMGLLRAYDVPKSVCMGVLSLEILPAVFLGARLTFSIALVISVVSEMVFTPRSGWALGSHARDAEINFDTPEYYACVFIVGVFGYGLNYAMRKVEERL